MLELVLAEALRSHPHMVGRFWKPPKNPYMACKTLS